MKKILCVMGVAAFMLGASSCSKTGSTASTPEADSLGITMGKAIGMSIGADYKSMPEADKAKFNKDQFLAGLKTVLLADTANMAYLQGVSVGMNMLMQLMQMNGDSVQVNRDLLYKNFAEYYKLDSVSAEQQAGYPDRVSDSDAECPGKGYGSLPGSSAGCHAGKAGSGRQH